MLFVVVLGDSTGPFNLVVHSVCRPNILPGDLTGAVSAGSFIEGSVAQHIATTLRGCCGVELVQMIKVDVQLTGGRMI